MDTSLLVWPPTDAEREAFFVAKYGEPSATGWGPRTRRQFGYYTPADHYEMLVSRLVRPGIRWLDVGGGRAIFPENGRLSRTLAQRCGELIAVDPSDNVQEHPYAHHRVQAFLEDYHHPEPFELATMRMVVEHVEYPDRFVRALDRLLVTGGLAVILTINRWAPLSLLAYHLPFSLHHPIKAAFWGGEEKDTFPVQYRMNDRSCLQSVFCANGFTCELMVKIDDLATFSKYRLANRAELWLRQATHLLGVAYPENCLLAVFRKR
jgi:SAM-dependent methyltransferase